MRCRKSAALVVRPVRRFLGQSHLMYLRYVLSIKLKKEHKKRLNV